MIPQPSIALDRQLIEQCIAGQKDAWTELFCQCHPMMLRQIALWVQPRNCGELIEEIAGRVWFKLVENRFARLAKFDPSRGVKLSTYMVALTRNECLMFLREEKRRQYRESRRARAMSARMIDEMPGIELEIEEFLASLLAAEKAVAGEQLFGVASDSDVVLPADIQLKLKRRNVNKLRQYLGLKTHDSVSSSNEKSRRNQKKSAK
jgi:DNA-directed RNA polymerase specialized sigma24 family protein